MIVVMQKLSNPHIIRFKKNGDRKLVYDLKNTDTTLRFFTIIQEIKNS